MPGRSAFDSLDDSVIGLNLADRGPVMMSTSVSFRPPVDGAVEPFTAAAASKEPVAADPGDVP